MSTDDHKCKHPNAARFVGNCQQVAELGWWLRTWRFVACVEAIIGIFLMLLLLLG